MNPLLQADGTIEDEELRSIFHSESEEHLHGLDEGLLLLEGNPTHAATLQNLFRHAHNLKGTARMLGLDDLGAIAHHFEDVLGEAQRGERVLALAEITELCHHIDPMRQLVLQAVTGQVAQIDVASVLNQLHQGMQSQAPANSAPAKMDAEPVPVDPYDFGSFTFDQPSFADTGHTEPKDAEPVEQTPVAPRPPSSPAATAVFTARLRPRLALNWTPSGSHRKSWTR